MDFVKPNIRPDRTFRWYHGNVNATSARYEEHVKNRTRHCLRLSTECEIMPAFSLPIAKISCGVYAHIDKDAHRRYNQNKHFTLTTPGNGGMRCAGGASAQRGHRHRNLHNTMCFQRSDASKYGVLLFHSTHSDNGKDGALPCSPPPDAAKLPGHH